MIDMDQKAQTHSVILRLNILISKYMNLDDIGRVPFRDADRQGEGEGHSSPPRPLKGTYRAGWFRMTNLLFGHFDSIGVFDTIIYRAR